MKRIFIVLAILLIVLTGCESTVELTQEERDSLIAGSVFQPEETVEVIYEPYEVVKYVYPEEEKIITPTDTKGGTSSEELLNNTLDENTVSIDEPSDFRSGIVEYNFTDGKIYDIWTTPNHVTDIRLAPGESISGKAAIGDSESWQLDTAVSSENNRSVTHIYIKPVTIGIETSLIVPTDQRTYYISLKSFESLHMVGVRWKYPGIYTFGSNAASTNTTETGDTTLLSFDPASLNFKYKISGKNSIWKPTSVFDDGVHTYIQFDPRFNSSAGAPALYLLPSPHALKSKIEVVNYVINGNLYITDFVLQDKQTWFLMNENVEIKIERK